MSRHSDLEADGRSEQLLHWISGSIGLVRFTSEKSNPDPDGSNSDFTAMNFLRIYYGTIKSNCPFDVVDDARCNKVHG